MAGINDLQAKLKVDSALAEKFKGCKSLDDVISLAKAEGFDISVEDIEKLTDVSAEDLTKAAGGAFIAASGFHVIASSTTAVVV
jgi:predicted ribosomally synthesized peptide with nif11-like leader